MESSFLLMIVYDMLLSVPSIKTISRSLTLVVFADISTPWSLCMSSECFQNSSASWLKFLSQDTCSVKIKMLVSHMLCFLNVIIR